MVVLLSRMKQAAGFCIKAAGASLMIVALHYNFNLICISCRVFLIIEQYLRLAEV